MNENLELEIPVSLKLTVKREALLRLFDVFSGRVADKVNKASVEPAPAETTAKTTTVLDLQPELDLATRVKESRHGRKRHRRVILDDNKSYSADNALDLFRNFGVLDHYPTFHSSTNGKRRGVVEKEAYVFRDILKKERGICLVSYSAYDFDGTWKTIELGA